MTWLAGVSLFLGVIYLVVMYYGALILFKQLTILARSLTAIAYSIDMIADSFRELTILIRDDDDPEPPRATRQHIP